MVAWSTAEKRAIVEKVEALEASVEALKVMPTGEIPGVPEVEVVPFTLEEGRALMGAFASVHRAVADSLEVLSDVGLVPDLKFSGRAGVLNLRIIKGLPSPEVEAEAPVEE